MARQDRAAGRGWTGDFRVRARVTKNGRLVTWCMLGKTGWSAKRIR